MVNTLKRNKWETPKCLLDTKHRQTCSTKFGFGDNSFLLLSYVLKKGKNVMKLSTIHTQGDIDQNSRDEKLPSHFIICQKEVYTSFHKRLYQLCAT